MPWYRLLVSREKSCHVGKPDLDRVPWWYKVPDEPPYAGRSRLRKCGQNRKKLDASICLPIYGDGLHSKSNNMRTTASRHKRSFHSRHFAATGAVSQHKLVAA